MKFQVDRYVDRLQVLSYHMPIDWELAYHRYLCLSAARLKQVRNSGGGYTGSSVEAFVVDLSARGLVVQDLPLPPHFVTAYSQVICHVRISHMSHVQEPHVHQSHVHQSFFVYLP